MNKRIISLLLAMVMLCGMLPMTVLAEEEHTHTYENGICTGCGTAQPGPVITRQPVDCKAKMGEAFCVTVEADGEGLKYQWYVKEFGTTTWIKSSITDNTYDTVMTAQRAGRQIYCVITDANGKSVTTNTVQLVLLPSEPTRIWEQWTRPVTMAAGTYPAYGGATTGYYSKGQTFSGILYSSTMRDGRDVLWNLNSSTYYSAVANPASLLYTTDYRGRVFNESAWAGSVCSTTALKACGYAYPYTTTEIPMKFDEKTDHSIDNLEFGDILWTKGHVAGVVGVTKDDDGHVTSVNIIEQASYVRVFEITAQNWDTYFSGHWTHIYRGDFDETRTAPEEYPENLSIIFERGNNTYVTDCKTMLFYIPTATTVYATKDGVMTSYDKASFPARTVNGVTVYDLASLFSGIGDYYFHTEENTTDICIKVIDKGSITISDTKATLHGYENCEILGYRIIKILDEAKSSAFNFFEAPEGYTSEAVNLSFQWLSSDTFDIENIPGDTAGWKLEVYYDTGYGWARSLSRDIIYGEEPHAHTYTPTVTPPTCTEQGYTTYTCECGDSYVADYVDAAGHTYGERFTCSKCAYKAKISVLGDSISTYSGISGVKNAVYPNSTVKSVSDTWWKQVVDILGGEVLKVNASGGSRILSDEYFNGAGVRDGNQAAYRERCVNLHVGNDDPDIIFVFMGTNDFSYHVESGCDKCRILSNCTECTTRTDGNLNVCADCRAASGVYSSFCSLPLGTADSVDVSSVTPTSSCEAYALMLSKMKTAYPDARIYCLGLLPRVSPYQSVVYHDHGQPTAFNAELKKVAENAGAVFIDLEQCLDNSVATWSTYFGDAVHPTDIGMDKISQAVVSGIFGNEVYMVSSELAGGIALTGESMVIAGETYEASIITIDNDWQLNVRITMNGEDVTESAYNKETGKINITNVTGNIVVRVKVKVTEGEITWSIGTISTINGSNADNYPNRIRTGFIAIDKGIIVRAANNAKINAVFYDENYKILSAENNSGWTIEWSSANAPAAAVYIRVAAKDESDMALTVDYGNNITLIRGCPHTYTPTVTPPTCTKQGYTTYTCECGDSYVADYVDARGYDWMLEDGEFNLLLIGNSFSEDASSCGQGMQESQLLNILQTMLGEDVKVTVGLCYSGGKGLNWHATQSEQDNRSYSLRVISSEGGKWKSMGSYTSANALGWTDWDVVTLQHYELNTSTGEESNAYPEQVDPKFHKLKAAAEFMLDHVDRYAPDAEVYFYTHWSRAYASKLNDGLAAYNQRAAFIPEVLEYAGPETAQRFETIIPVGLSVQNARTTYLALLAYNTTAYADKNLNLYTDAQIGLQRDGGHLSFNIGRYIAGLTFAETIIPEELRADGYVLPDIRITESVGRLPKEYTVIAQKAVLAAVDSWKNGSLAVTTIEGYEADPTVDAGKTLQSSVLEIACAANAEALTAEISRAVLEILPDDFAVDAVNVPEGALAGGSFICDVTIRFGYTSLTVAVNCKAAEHTYTNSFCTACGKQENTTATPLDEGMLATSSPKNYLAISNPATEKLACAPAVVTYGGGKMAVAYLADEVNDVETESSTTIVCRLGLFDLDSPQNGTFLDITAAGQTIGDVTIGQKAPYEPNLLVLEDGKLLVLFNIRDTSGKYIYYSATVDPEDKTVTAYTPLTLDGKTWIPANIAASYNAIADNTISSSGPSVSMVFTSQIVEHEGYYYGYCGGICSGFSGILVRSADGINWTSVMTPEALPEMAGVIECGFRFFNDYIYFCMRDISSGVYQCSYNFATGEQLVRTHKLPDLTTSKPAAFTQDGKLYLIANKATGDDATIGRRNMAMFYEVDAATCRLSLVRQIFCADGCAYHSVVNVEGINYWAFHTDARRINPYTQGRSNIAFLAVPTLYSHTYESVVTASTCTERGYTTHICTACGYSYVDSYVEALGHRYESDICIVCGKEKSGVLNLSDYSDMYASGCITVAANVWQTGVVNYHYQIPLVNFADYNQVTVTANSANKSYIAFFTQRMTKAGAIAYADGWTEVLVMEPGTTQTLTIPADARYMYILNNNAAGDSLLPENVVFSCNHTYENGICTGCGEAEPGYHIPGDINGDGSVNNKDFTRLFQYLADWDVEVVEAALDVNGDGSVNNKDLTRLFQYLSDWDVELK